GSRRRHSVTREMPSAAAARWRFHRCASSTWRIRLRSSTTSPLGAQLWRPRRSSRPAPVALAKTSSASSAFSSSRTLPGQAWAVSERSAAGLGGGERGERARVEGGVEEYGGGGGAPPR